MPTYDDLTHHVGFQLSLFLWFDHLLFTYLLWFTHLSVVVTISTIKTTKEWSRFIKWRQRIDTTLKKERMKEPTIIGISQKDILMK